MKIEKSVVAVALAASAGLAVAQPTIDGVFDSVTEAGFYGDILWTNANSTSFGDNMAGENLSASIGDPEAVTTGVEFSIAKSVLGNATSFRVAGWVNSGDRTFISNQIIHDGTLPANTGNIGGDPNFETDARFPGKEYATVSAIPAGTATVDGTLDAAVYTTRYFTQTNFTGFGDNGDATAQGGGGSEIDALYVAQDANNYYFFVAGNLESNGNGLDLFIDTDNGATGQSGLGVGSGDGGFILDGNGGLTFDADFAANVLVSIDSTFDDDAMAQTPRAYLAADLEASNTVDLLGTIAGYGAANAGALIGGGSLGVDNSNIAGVPGSPVGTSPTAPDADFAYGNEMNNLRAQIVTNEVGEDFLYLFMGANLNNGFEKLVIFVDCTPGGQNVMRDDNVDISFGGLNAHAGLTFDAGFEPDYWMNINNGLAGGTTLINFMDAATLRTDGPLFNLFTGAIEDYGSFFGGDVAAFDGTPAAAPVQLMDFSGPDAPIQDGTLPNLQANFGPRQLQLDPMNPIPGLIQGAIDNSNVGGVTETEADPAAANAVNSGVEFQLDLAELGWDGESDIKVTAWIADAGFGTVSNNVVGLPAGSGNLTFDPTPDMPDSGDEVNLGDIDFTTIPGDQFVVVPLAGDTGGGCNPADIAEPFGVLDLADIDAFILAFGAGDAAADIAAPAGVLDLADIDLFILEFFAGCP